MIRQAVIDQLKTGARLKLRFNKAGEAGDFLLYRGGKMIAVVPRKTIAGICGAKTSASSRPAVEGTASAPPVKRGTPSPPPVETPLLDGLARSLSGKAFARLSPYEQEHLRNLAERLV